MSRPLLVTHRFPPDGVGGVERYVERLHAALRQHGVEAHVLTRTPRHLPRRPRLRHEGDVYRIVGSGVRLQGFLARHEAVEQAFLRTLDEVRPTVVHVNHLLGISPRIVALAKDAGLPVLLSVHDYYLACPLVHLVRADASLCEGPDHGRACRDTCFADEGPSAGRWELRHAYFRELMGLADAVICPSEGLARYLHELAPSGLFQTVPLGVDRPGSPAQPRVDESAPLTLALVGTAGRHKGVFRVVEALGLAKVARVRLRIVGGFDTEAEQRLLVEAARTVPGLELEITGRFLPADLSGLLAGVDAVVAASLVPEAFPLAPREALLLGVPVLATRLGGLADIIADGRNGLQFDGAEGLAEAVQRLAADRVLRLSLREGARETVVPSFEGHVGVLRAMYGQLAASPVQRSTARFQELHGQLLAAGFARGEGLRLSSLRHRRPGAP